MKKLNNDVFSNVNKNDQLSQKTKINENFDKKNDNLRIIFYMLINVFTFRRKNFEMHCLNKIMMIFIQKFWIWKKFQLIRRKYWWFDLIRNVKKTFKFYIDCYRINFTKRKFYIFFEFLSMSKNFRQNWILNFIVDFFSCRFLNSSYNNILIIMNRFTKHVIYISIRKNWKIKNSANALTNNVFKYFDMFVLIVND